MAKCTVRVKCHNCGNTWLVDLQDIEKRKVNHCYKCDAEIPVNIWDKQIVKAAQTVFECNLTLDRTATRINNKQFSIDFLGTDGEENDRD